MGTHPIFESDFDCLTDNTKRFNMVCLDIHFKNNSRYEFTLCDINDSARKHFWRRGNRTIPAHSTNYQFGMLPESGFFGVECGIQGTATLKCSNPRFDINIAYDFPAAGNDHFSANPSDARFVKTTFKDNGKWGTDNPHNLILTISENPQFCDDGANENEDTTGRFFADIGKEGATAGISRALGQ